MDRRGFHAALLAASLSCAVSPVVGAEPAPKKRLGILAIGSATTFLDGGRQDVLDALAALGYVAGRNLVLEERYQPATPEALAAFARELASANVDAILTEGTSATLAAQQATRAIPIVTTVGDFVAAGFAHDVQRPGGNITGLSQNRAELAEKQLETLRELRPRLAAVAILYEKPYPGAESLYRPIIEAAARLSIAAPVMPYDSGGIRVPLQELARRRIDTAISLGTSGGDLEEVVRHGIALMVPGATEVAAGALIAMENNGSGDPARLAAILDRVFRGANPAVIPIQGATRYRTTVNARTATALGIRLTPAIRLRADRIIE